LRQLFCRRSRPWPLASPTRLKATAYRLLTKDLEPALVRKTFVALLTLCLRLSPRQTATRSTFKDALDGRGSVSRKRIKTAKPVVPVQPDPPI
jgi:hypothetical protein